ncbi:MAG: hypothetical protein WCB10_19675 [Steroidobacteraceae bacterium]
MRIALASDAWTPQINGVVTMLKATAVTMLKATAATLIPLHLWRGARTLSASIPVHGAATIWLTCRGPS